MFKAPFDENRNYDEYLTKMNSEILKQIAEGNDDYMKIIVGRTGSGKTGLLFWDYEDCCRIKNITPNIKTICLDRENLADAFGRISTIPKSERDINYDEANVSKRDAMTGFNKDLLDVYSSVRGKNITHRWANPSLDMIDKPFITERVNCVILIGNKTPGVRYYYHFTKEKILMILAKYGRLDINLLYKVRKKYSYYRGWFKEYTGLMKEEYLEMKNTRMDVKLESFAQKYGSKECKEYVTRSELAKMLLVNITTLANHEKKLLEQGVDASLFMMTASGRRLYDKSLIDLFKKSLEVGVSNSKTGLALRKGGF